MRRYIIFLISIFSVIACNKKNTQEVKEVVIFETKYDSQKILVLFDQSLSVKQFLLENKEYQLKHLGQVSRSQNKHLFQILNTKYTFDILEEIFSKKESILSVEPYETITR